MDNEKMFINLAPGTDKAELILREGAAVQELEPKAPIKTNIAGTIGTVVEYLTKRINYGQFEESRSYIIVNREDITIRLIINENDEYTRGNIVGALAVHPKFAEFGINSNRVWTPTELGMFIKMNRAFFVDKTENMKLVTNLMNFTATVNNSIDRSVKENGNRIDNFAQVVNSNLPASFKLRIPIFKGMQPEDLEVETFAKVDGRDVSFVLFSPGANQTLEELRDKVIDDQLAMIKDIAPNIAIIEE